MRPSQIVSDARASRAHSVVRACRPNNRSSRDCLLCGRRRVRVQQNHVHLHKVWNGVSSPPPLSSTPDAESPERILAYKNGRQVSVEWLVMCKSHGQCVESFLFMDSS